MSILFSAAPPPLSTRALAVGYRTRRTGTRTLLHDLDLALHPGELVCLLGRNGVGKSTLLRTLSGMQPALSGSVLLGGVELHTLPLQERARRLGVVLTDRPEPGLMTAREVIALGRYPYTDWSGTLSDDDEAIVDAAIDATGTDFLAARQLTDLSDGERQKVMIARALAQQPGMILLDEPTAYLDLPHRVEIMRLLRALASEQRTALLVSTHDLDLALHLADRLWLMPGDGSLRIGTPDELVIDGALARAFAGVAFVRDDAGGYAVRYAR